MEKTIKWEPNEAVQLQQIEQEKTQTLAQIGALMMDLETAKKNLDNINDRHRAAIKLALSNRGIGHFESARPFQGGISLTIPESGPVNGGA